MRRCVLCSARRRRPTPKTLPRSTRPPPRRRSPGERGPFGPRIVAPGDALYRHAVEEQLRRNGFDVDANVPRFVDRDPPASVSKLELSRDGAKVGTLDLSATPARLELVNREANALCLESFWKGLDAEEQLSVSYLPPAGGSDTLTTVSAKKSSPEYARVVRLPSRSDTRRTRWW